MSKATPTKFLQHGCHELIRMTKAGVGDAHKATTLCKKNLYAAKKFFPKEEDTNQLYNTKRFIPEDIYVQEMLHKLEKLYLYVQEYTHICKNNRIKGGHEFESD